MSGLVSSALRLFSFVLARVFLHLAQAIYFLAYRVSIQTLVSLALVCCVALRCVTISLLRGCVVIQQVLSPLALLLLRSSCSESKFKFSMVLVDQPPSISSTLISDEDVQYTPVPHVAPRRFTRRMRSNSLRDSSRFSQARQ